MLRTTEYFSVVLVLRRSQLDDTLLFLKYNHRLDIQTISREVKRGENYLDN